jgi:leucyl aminopeptidase
MASYGASFEYSTGSRAALGADVLIVPLIVKPKPPLQWLARVDNLCDDALTELVNVGAINNDVGHLAHSTRNGACRRVLAVSLGDADKLNARQVRKAAGAAASWLIEEHVRKAALWLDALVASNVELPAAEWAAGMALAGFRFTAHKTEDRKPIDRVRIVVHSGTAAHAATAVDQMRAGSLVADAVNYARGLAHEPANIMHPGAVADAARKLARQQRLRCTVYEAPQLRRMRAAGLLAVGQGAEHGPCLIRLDYRGAPRARTNTVLIGKAITFDTGGYSIKPAQGLEGLKYDKCGGCAVLGVLRAAASLKLRCNITGLIAAAENAISERAYRPSDILRMMNGKTVEIISTDAEGRLVLADALCFAQRHCAPTAMIDLATLTGGVNVALGKAAAGLMSNDDTLAAELEEAGRRTHERLWRLPLWDDYRELIKGADSDLKNSAGKRDAHAIVGGMFLKEFVDDKAPWAHLDIAAVATEEGDKSATGFGVRLLIDYLSRRSTR